MDTTIPEIESHHLERLEQALHRRIARALEVHQGRVQPAAAELGVTEGRLRRLIAQWPGLEARRRKGRGRPKGAKRLPKKNRHT